MLDKSKQTSDARSLGGKNEVYYHTMLRNVFPYAFAIHRYCDHTR
jgi:hypothetical protein